jgi:hypothetical protein
MTNPEIPISAAKEIADKYGFDQIIIIGRKVDVCEHVTTYGTTATHCAVAAMAGDFLKYDVMKWPREAGEG